MTVLIDLRGARQPHVRVLERLRVGEQPGDGQRVGGLHEQRPRSGQRQRPLAHHPPDDRIIGEVAAGSGCIQTV